MFSRARHRTALLLGFAGACVEQTPLAPGPAVITVHAVLNPAERVQHVVVARKPEGGTGYDQPVSGATVSLVTPDGATLAATEVSTPPSDFYFPATPSPHYDIATNSVTVGRPYRLRIVLPTGEVIEGATAAPAAAPATSVSERRLDRDADTLRLAWPRVPGARAYEVRVFLQRDSLFSYDGYITYTDTSIVLPGTATMRGRPIFAEGLPYDLVVTAIDANYYMYYGFDSDQYTGTALPTSLQGAVGVFGAVVPIVRMSITVEGVDPRLR
jgi:hypothetical protein